MHIVEVDEHLDYGRFWQGRESTTEAGHAYWEITQGLADSYPCPPCKEGAQALAHGGHDAISIILGKKGAPFTPKHFENFLEIAHQAEHKYRHMKAKHEVEGDEVG